MECDTNHGPPHQSIGREDGYGDDRPQIEDHTRRGEEEGVSVECDPEASERDRGRDRTTPDPRTSLGPVKDESGENDPDGHDPFLGAGIDLFSGFAQGVAKSFWHFMTSGPPPHIMTPGPSACVCPEPQQNNSNDNKNN